MRKDGRAFDDLRQIKIERNYTKYAEGSVYISLGDTKVLCNATIEDKVPAFMRSSGNGWITAEYSMLPRATKVRTMREVTRGKVGGRTAEIQRLIGRALRSVMDLKLFGERTLWLDCDVLQADGGTRVTAITGAFVAAVDAFNTLLKKGVISKLPVTDFVAATSVGLIGGQPYLDLCFEEDSSVDVDMNVVMTGTEKYVEIQGTGEASPFNSDQLQQMLDYAKLGILELVEAQEQALGLNSKLILAK